MTKTSNQFEGLLDRFFHTLLQDNPTFSTTAAGLPDGEGKLGHLTLDYHKKRERERQSALRALEGLSPRELSNEQQLDRLALRSLLLKESEDFARARHTLEPHAPDHLLNMCQLYLDALSRAFADNPPVAFSIPAALLYPQ